MLFFVKQLIFFLKKWWIAIAYAAIIVIATPAMLAWQYKIFFWIYAGMIFFIVFQKTKSRFDTEISDGSDMSRAQKIFFVALLALSIIFLVATRLIPFIRFGEAPLGYDTGFYVERFNSFINGNSEYFPYYFNVLPFAFSGISTLNSINAIYLFSQILLVGGIYFFCRSLNIKNNFVIASIAVFLFAASVTQFQAYWWMLGQQILAMAFLFFTFGLIFRKSYLAIFIASVGIMIHPPTFIVLAFAIFVLTIAYIVKLIIKRRLPDRKILLLLICAACTVAVTLALKSEYFWFVFSKFIIQHKGLATTFSIFEIKKMLGMFINAGTFHVNSYFIIPFSIIGLLLAKSWKKALFNKFELLVLFYAASVGILILTIIPFIYQQRFLIVFDAFLIIFAAPIVFIFINSFFEDKIGKFIILLFLLIFCARISLVVKHQMPQLFPEEYREIIALKFQIEPDSVVMTPNSLYDPWLRGFAPFMIISPGMENDVFSLNEWSGFWYGGDDEQNFNLLNKILYNKARNHLKYLYIFIGNRENANLPYQQFIRNNPRFKSISPHFWKYLPTI